MDTPLFQLQDIMNATEKIVREMIENAKNIAPQFEFDPSWFSVAKTPFPRISYQEVSIIPLSTII